MCPHASLRDGLAVIQEWRMAGGVECYNVDGGRHREQLSSCRRKDGTIDERGRSDQSKGVIKDEREGRT